MLLASETSIQLTNALEKLIDSGIQLGVFTTDYYSIFYR